MLKADCIIVGAGLSGLACAMTLRKKGIETLVVEADSIVGGRVKTLKTPEGYVTDVGFQVLLSSYPELKNFVDLTSLNLQNFNSGALVFDGQDFELLANPLGHPETLISSLFIDLLSTKDKLLVLKLIASSHLQRSDAPLGRTSTAVFLKEFGFSDKFIELFWCPFLTGIFLDSDLEIGSEFFKFLMRCFSLGKVSIPEYGMQQLPIQMANQLPKESLLFNQSVKSWASDSVVLQNGERLTAKKIICSVDPLTVTKNPTENEFRMVTTHYFTSDVLKTTVWGKWLVLVPQKFKMGIDHFCLISSVSEKYGNGTPLLSVSIVGKKDVPITQVIRELNTLAKQDLKLELVVSHCVPRALPRLVEDTSGFKMIDSVLYCGDRWASPSINGALRSGRLAAESILRDFEITNS